MFCADQTTDKTPFIQLSANTVVVTDEAIEETASTQMTPTTPTGSDQHSVVGSGGKRFERKRSIMYQLSPWKMENATEEMFRIIPDLNISDAEGAHLLAQSCQDPSVLVGWQVSCFFLINIKE